MDSRQHISADELDQFRSIVAEFFTELVPAEALHARLDAGGYDERTWARFCRELDLGAPLLDTRYGGAGLSVREAAIVAEEAGRVLYDGPYLSHWLAVHLLSSASGDEGVTALLPQLATGSRVAVAGLEPGAFAAAPAADGSWTLDGAMTAADAECADLFVVAADHGDLPELFVVDRGAVGVRVAALTNLDSTRRCARVDMSAVPARRLAVPDPATVLAETARLAVILSAAEMIGAARYTADRAVAYGTMREQFGRSIASFQAVKHRLASMHVAVEAAAGTVREVVDASLRGDSPARCDLAASVAKVAAADAFEVVSRDNIHIHGGIGFTWEHDAHLYYRRAIASASRFGTRRRHVERIAVLTETPVTPAVRNAVESVDEDAAAAAFRARVHTWFAAALEEGTAPNAQQPPRVDYDDPDVRRAAGQYQRSLHEAGLAGPHYPTEYGGRDEPAAYARIIREEARTSGAGQDRLFQVGVDMIAPTIATVGSTTQQQRYLPPMLRGDEVWCELFSEPGAGSDLAGVTTSARRDGDDWVVRGHKLWTSYAHLSDFGVLLARTDPDAPKHRGLTMFVVDMSAPGITVRPLRQITGDAEFNEVFLDDVRIPADRVLGEVNGGWAVTRTILTHERLALAASGDRRIDHAWLQDIVARLGLDNPVTRTSVAEFYVRQEELRTCTEEVAARVAAGLDLGPEGSVLKIIKARTVQQACRMAVDMIGENALAWDPATDEGATAGVLAGALLRSHAISIAGGTDNIQHNIVAERILGLPRD